MARFHELLIHENLQRSVDRGQITAMSFEGLMDFLCSKWAMVLNQEFENGQARPSELELRVF
jgi:hypothetical protein